jgi:hypothetical protein
MKQVAEAISVCSAAARPEKIVIHGPAPPLRSLSETRIAVEETSVFVYDNPLSLINEGEGSCRATISEPERFHRTFGEL